MHKCTVDRVPGDDMQEVEADHDVGGQVKVAAVRYLPAVCCSLENLAQGAACMDNSCASTAVASSGSLLAAVTSPAKMRRPDSLNLGDGGHRVLRAACAGWAGSAGGPAAGWPV